MDSFFRARMPDLAAIDTIDTVTNVDKDFVTWALVASPEH